MWLCKTAWAPPSGRMIGGLRPHVSSAAGRMAEDPVPAEAAAASNRTYCVHTYYNTGQCRKADSVVSTSKTASARFTCFLLELLVANHVQGHLMVWGQL